MLEQIAGPNSQKKMNDMDKIHVANKKRK